VSNTLAMLRRLPSQRRRGLREEAVLEGYGRVRRGFPATDRRRLQQAGEVAASAVVAKDGSGDLTTVSEAVAAAPNNSDARYVISIKAGGYLENVEVGSHKTNLMFVGDGMWKTVIKASRNFVDNSTTFRSATLGAFTQATNLSHRCTACTTLFFAPLLLDLTVVGTGRVNKICSRGGHGFPDGGERGGSEQSQAADHDTSIRCAVEIEFIINSNLLLILKKLSSGPRRLYVASHLA
jgi:hypothetical protein